MCGWVEADEGRVGLEDESHKEASDTDGKPVDVDQTLEKAAVRVDEAESAKEVVEHPGVLQVVEDVEGDTEKRKEALTQPRLDMRLDPPPPMLINDIHHLVLEPLQAAWLVDGVEEGGSRLVAPSFPPDALLSLLLVVLPMDLLLLIEDELGQHVPGTWIVEQGEPGAY